VTKQRTRSRFRSGIRIKRLSSNLASRALGIRFLKAFD
jgi:hypothetical protein